MLKFQTKTTSKETQKEKGQLSFQGDQAALLSYNFRVCLCSKYVLLCSEDGKWFIFLKIFK